MSDRLFIGAMSGTSCDGVDAALVRVAGVGASMRASFLHLTSRDYPAATRSSVAAVRGGPVGVGELAAVGATVARHYADCVAGLLRETGTRPGDVTAAAAHGQTLFHAPPLTYQAFDPTILAAAVGIDVVSDFRRADCAAGGQGAPLVPFGDWVLFRANRPRVLLNLGGIANVTLLGTGGLDTVAGYDLGPANCLSDWVMRDRGGIDPGGRLAAGGRAIDGVVAAALADPFFDRPPPKSTDTPAMIALCERALRSHAGAPLPDRLATANALAAAAIGTQIDRALGRPPRPAADGRDEIYVAGGGVRNRHLMGLLTDRLGPVRPTDELGVPTQAREAAAFALLAAAHVDRFACYMPRVTGATRPAVLGTLTPKA